MIELFPRKCEYEPCGKGMREGFVVDGHATYCSIEHVTAATGITKRQWDAGYSDDGEDYWTEWELEDGEPRYNAEGVEVETKHHATLAALHDLVTYIEATKSSDKDRYVTALLVAIAQLEHDEMEDDE